MNKQSLDLGRRFASQCRGMITPLVLVTTLNPNGTANIAPKIQAMGVGRGNYYAFACTLSHHTYQNVKREGEFVVNFPGPELLDQASRCAAATPEGVDEIVAAGLTPLPAEVVKPPRVTECRLHLECVAVSTLDGFGSDSLIIGRIVAASCDEEDHIPEGAGEKGPARLGCRPLLAYVEPNCYTVIREADRFPFPRNYKE